MIYCAITLLSSLSQSLRFTNCAVTSRVLYYSVDPYI